MRFFFYGTLRDADVRAIVLASPPEAIATRPARLSGHQAVAFARLRYPSLRRRDGATASGEVVSGLDRIDAIRIAHFEGEGYRLAKQDVRLDSGRLVSAWVCLPRRSLAGRTAGEWDLARWQRLHKSRFLKRAQSWMMEFPARKLLCGYRVRHWRRPVEAAPPAQRIRRRAGAR